MPEELNPYAPPKADIEQALTSPSQRIGWKVYAYIVVVLQILGIFSHLRRGNLAEMLDDCVTIVGLMALFGYAYRRPIWKRRIWMLWAVLFPVSNGMIGLWVYPRAEIAGPIRYFITLIAFSPQYLAVIRYAYTSREVWKGAVERDAG